MRHGCVRRLWVARKQCAQKLQALVERVGLDEVLVVTDTYETDDRLFTYEALPRGQAGGAADARGRIGGGRSWPRVSVQLRGYRRCW